MWAASPASPLADRARGRWAAILPLLGVDPKCLRDKHGPCPICGGKDRFRWDDKGGRGSFYCSGSCGAGDGFKLAMLANGCEFRDVAERVERLVGAVPRAPARPAGRSDDEKRLALRRLWASSSPVSPDDPVSRWLRRRAGVLQVPTCLRCHASLLYREPDEPEGRYPAMISLIRAPDGTAVQLHRTWLDHEGRKAPVGKPRKLMPGSFPAGSAVRLMPHQGLLGVAEGVETAFAASFLHATPCWAALTAGNLAQWVPPNDVREVVVFSDNDVSYAGQAAAYALAQRLVGKGIPVRVEVPLDPGQDWNDVMRGRH